MELEETKKIPLTVAIVVENYEIIYSIWDKNKCLKITEQGVYDQESKNKFLEAIEEDLQTLKEIFKADFYISKIVLEFSNCDFCSNITFANTIVFLVLLLNELSYRKYYLPNKRPKIETIEKSKWENDYLNIYKILNEDQVRTLHIEKYLDIRKDKKHSNLVFKEKIDTIRAFNLGAYLIDLKNKKEKELEW